MPLINQKPRIMGDGTKKTVYRDTVGENYISFSFNAEQESMTIWNKGKEPIQISVGSYANETISRYESQTFETNFSSFQIRSTEGVNEFYIEADEVGEDFGSGNVGSLANITQQLAETSTEIKKKFLNPYFVEYFASFNKYGLGVPSGIANYTGGNFTLTVSGNAGDTFLTVTGGTIADAGGVWACVIQNDDGLYDINKVMSNDGVNTVTLLRPLKKNITSGTLANLHDSDLGQHYTEHGYFAFAQHFYFANPRYAERNEVLSQFLPSDTSGNWVINGTHGYNHAKNMTSADDTYFQVGSKRLYLYATDNTKYAEYTQSLDNKKGYVETEVGAESGDVKIEFYLDDVFVDSKTITREVHRVIFPFEYAKTGKIKIIGLGGYPQVIAIGKTTWFTNEKYSKETLINPNDKVVFIGDSWGEYHNQATKRELERLMTADGGTPTVLNYSASGHSSDYAVAWFEDYVINEKPDKVIIEYFTNDFNSIGGTDLGTFTNPDGQQEDMNIASLDEYVQNIRWMVDEAIKNGIQPIVIMPASTNSETQAQNAANYTQEIWLGTQIVNDNPTFKNTTSETVTTSTVTSKSGGSVGQGVLDLKSKEINSSARKGVKSDTDTGAAITGGDIHGFYNNNVRKAGVKHDGTLDAPFIQLQTQSSNIGADANSRGSLYMKDDPTLDDSVYIILQKADGTYARFKLSGVFE